ncbi:hypothetical protein ACFE04_023812 [Oxalis oulophora]
MAAVYFSFLAIWLLIFACDYTEEARVVIHEDTVNGPGVCQDPCQNLQPPPPPPGGEGYPIYGAPPPPQLPPPPPPPQATPGAGQANCSQYPNQCCNNNNFNNNPPPFTYVPVNYADKPFTVSLSAMLLVSLFVTLL